MEPTDRGMYKGIWSIVGSVAAVAVVVAAVVTSYVNLNNRVDALVPEVPRHDERLKALERTVEDIGRAVEEIGQRGGVMVETGVVQIHRDDYPQLENGEIGVRGAINVRVDFNTPFEAPPKVMIALSRFDIVQDEAYHRLAVSVVAVDRDGFVCSFITWANTRVWNAEATWIAVAPS